MSFVASTVRAIALLAFVTTGAFGQSASGNSGIRINLDEPPAPKPVAPTAKPASPVPPAAKAAPKGAKSGPAAKKAEPAPKIDGFVIDRGAKGYLGVKIESGVFKISFYDQDKKPAGIDVSGAVLRWPVNYQRNDERTMLTPAGDGKSLSSEKVVRPQSNYKLFITLLKTGDTGEQVAVENYVVDFAP
jgi:hypothetical protein